MQLPALCRGCHLLEKKTRAILKQQAKHAHPEFQPKQPTGLGTEVCCRYTACSLGADLWAA